MDETELYLGLVIIFTILYTFYRFRCDGRSKEMRTRCSVNNDALFSVPLNHDPSERKLKFYEKTELMTNLFEDATTMLEALQRGKRESVDGFCMGRVIREKEQVEWLSYDDIFCSIKNFGDGLFAGLQQSPHHSVIGMFANNRVEYAIAEYGCYWHSMVIAPIYNTLGPNVCTFIANQAEIEVIVCDTLDRVQAVLSQATHFTHLKHIVTMDQIPKSYVSKAQNYNLQIHSFDEVEKLGAANPCSPNHPQPDDLAVICYTSGTTGNPKGVMLTHKNVVSSTSGLLYQLFEHRINNSDVFLSYLPLAHIMERVSEVSIYMCGAKVVYYSGDVQTIAEDMRIVRPTIFLTVPRLLNKIYDKIHDNVRGNLFKEWMLKTALTAKMRDYKLGKTSTNTIWDKLIFDKVRANLGGRIRVLASGSASLDTRVAEAVRSILGCVWVNGYGQTECCSCLMSIPFDNDTNTVGPPLASAYIRLEDIPEMNYYASEGKGEILVKGPLVTQGYFKDPIETEKLFDDDGWLLTGDVGAWTKEGNLRVIDRKKNHFKLAHGEFIAVEKLETAYASSLFVSQIYVYGDSARSFLVAIIVPEKEVLENWCLKNSVKGNFHDYCKDKRVKDEILQDLKNIAVREKFNKLEYIKRIYLHTNAFSIENNLLTPTMKMKRYELQKYFSKIIEELYK